MISVHQDRDFDADRVSDLSTPPLDLCVDRIEFEEDEDKETNDDDSGEGDADGVQNRGAKRRSFEKGSIFQDNVGHTHPIHPTLSSVIGKPDPNPSTDLVALVRYQQQQLRRQLSTIHSSDMLLSSPQPSAPCTGSVGNVGPIKFIFDEDAASSERSELRGSNGSSSLSSSLRSKQVPCASSSATWPSLALSESAKISPQLSEKEPTFPAKLQKILSNVAFQDMISWLPHGRSWRVIKPKAFEEKVIPLYFRHARYASFMRQVNGWGFQRITQGPDNHSYFHESFLRDVPGLALKMRRSSRSSRNRSAIKLHNIDLTAPLRIGGLDVDPIAFDPNSQMSRGLEPSNIPISHLPPTYPTMTSPEHRTSITSTSLPPRYSGVAPSIASAIPSVSEEQGFIEQQELMSNGLGPVLNAKRLDNGVIPSSNIDVENNDLVRKLNNIRRLAGMVPAGLNTQCHLDIPAIPNIPTIGRGGFGSMPQQQMRLLQLGLGEFGEVQPNNFSLSEMTRQQLPANLALQTNYLFGGNHETLNH